MRINKVRIDNYKSIANEQQLNMYGKVTAVIGKNESGKSNILKSIGTLSMDKYYNKAQLSDPSRNRFNDPTKIQLDLLLSDEEQKLLNVENNHTIIEFNTGEQKRSPKIIDGFNQEY